MNLSHKLPEKLNESLQNICNKSTCVSSSMILSGVTARSTPLVWWHPFSYEENIKSLRTPGHRRLWSERPHQSILYIIQQTTYLRLSWLWLKKKWPEDTKMWAYSLKGYSISQSVQRKDSQYCLFCTGHGMIPGWKMIPKLAAKLSQGSPRCKFWNGMASNRSSFFRQNILVVSLLLFANYQNP